SEPLRIVICSTPPARLIEIAGDGVAPLSRTKPFRSMSTLLDSTVISAVGAGPKFRVTMYFPSAEIVVGPKIGIRPSAAVVRGAVVGMAVKAQTAASPTKTIRRMSFPPGGEWAGALSRDEARVSPRLIRRAEERFNR